VFQLLPSPQATNGTHRSFTANTGEADDPANIAATLTANFVAALTEGLKKHERILPLGVGLNINLPTFSANCTEPPFTLTHLTGGAVIDQLVIRNTTGFPQWVNLVAPGLNAANSGNPHLPGETPTSATCKTSVSIFSVDYDAPSYLAGPIQAHLERTIIGHSRVQTHL